MMETLDPIEALKLIRKVALAAAGSNELGYLKTTMRDVLVIIDRAFLRKIQRTIDERMTVARHVGGEDADLAVRDLAGGTSVLPRHPARRLALLEKAGLVDHEDRIVIRQMLDDII